MVSVNTAQGQPYFIRIMQSSICMMKCSEVFSFLFVDLDLTTVVDKYKQYAQKKLI